MKLWTWKEIGRVLSRLILARHATMALITKVSLQRTTKIFMLVMLLQDIRQQKRSMKLNVMAASHAMCKLSSSLVLQPVVVLLSCVLGPEKLPMMGHLEQKKRISNKSFSYLSGPCCISELYSRLVQVFCWHSSFSERSDLIFLSVVFPLSTAGQLCLLLSCTFQRQIMYTSVGPSNLSCGLLTCSCFHKPGKFHRWAPWSCF